MRLIFAGTPAIAAQALRKLSAVHEVALVITREDAPVGRKQILTPSPVAQVADELGLPVEKTTNLSNRLEALKSVEADLAVVVAFGALVPKVALDLFPWWNIHYSLLPAWRGATPLQHSMMNDQGIGITIFELEHGLDTGPIISSKPMEFAPTETAGEALIRFTDVATNLLLDSLAKLPSATAQQGASSHAPKLSRNSARVDFEFPADRLARQINAMNPEPAAWTTLSGQPVKLLRAKSLGQVDWQTIDAFGEPGELWLSESRALLGCGEGTRLELLEIQPAGKKPMKAVDFIRGQQGAVKFV